MDRNTLTATVKTTTATAPAAQPKPSRMAPTAPVVKPQRVAPTAPKTAAQSNAATGSRHYAVGMAIAQYIADHGPIGRVVGAEWDRVWLELFAAADAVAVMPDETAKITHAIKCYMPGFVQFSAVAGILGKSVKPWDVLPDKWLRLVQTAHVDSGTFTDVLARMPVARLTDAAYDRLVKLNGDRAAVRALLASL